MNNLIVDSFNAGKRIDAYIAENVENMSRSGCVNLIEEGNITVNGKKIKKNYKVSEGDSIEITMPELKPYEALPQKMDLDIRYEDKDVLVINKPKGLVVHPAPGNEHGTLVNALLYHCHDLSGINGKIRPGIVHRIDKDTTGCLVACKNDMAHRAIAAQLADKTCHREYKTVVEGILEHDAAVIDAPIGRDPRDRQRMAVTDIHSREARTHYRVLERLKGYTYIECRLETGRTHQIRAHLAWLGIPVAGDPKYGLRTADAPLTERYRLTRQMLHAWEVRFPSSAEITALQGRTFRAGPPADFRRVMNGEELRWPEEGG